MRCGCFAGQPARGATSGRSIERRFGRGERSEEPEREAHLDSIPSDDAESLRELCLKLASLRADAPLIGLDELIQRAITAFDYDLATLLMKRGKRRYANLRKLMRLARGYEAAEGRDLRGFLDYVADSAALDREGEAATEAENHDGVRVMTVHAAKGLEFEVVAVADLGRELLAGARQPPIMVGADEPVVADRRSRPAAGGNQAVAARDDAGRDLRLRRDGRGGRRRRGSRGLPPRLRRRHAGTGSPDPERPLQRHPTRQAGGGDAPFDAGHRAPDAGPGRSGPTATIGPSSSPPPSPRPGLERSFGPAGSRSLQPA